MLYNKDILKLAIDNNCKSVAFCGISTGIYGYPLDAAAIISYTSVMTFLDTYPNDGIDVYFCCFREEELAAYKKLKNVHLIFE